TANAPGRPHDRALAREGNARINESGPFFAGALFCRSVPLPCHIEFPPKFKHFYFSGTRAEVNATKEGCCRMICLHERTVCRGKCETTLSADRRGPSGAGRSNTLARAARAVFWLLGGK